jgi:hypothetical protein
MACPCPCTAGTDIVIQALLYCHQPCMSHTSHPLLLLSPPPQQGLLQWSPALQAAALRVVAAASHPPAGAPQHATTWSGQQLSVLATLLVQPLPGPGCPAAQQQQQQAVQQQAVQQLAYQLLCGALARVCGADWEPALWVGCLSRLARCTYPSAATGSSNSSSSTPAAVGEGGGVPPLPVALVQFLVEAVAAAGRRPLDAAEVAAAVGGTLAGGSAVQEALGLQQVGGATRV